MTRTIDYYFICSSPFAYMGQKQLLELADRHDLQIRYKPIDIAAVWNNSGSVPVAKRPPLRQRYRRIELQRIADFRDLTLNVDPAYFPVDSAPADRVVIALVEQGEDPSGFTWRVHSGLWSKEENIASRDQLASYLNSEGFDAEAVLAASEKPEIEAIRQANTTEASEADAVGAPVYVWQGEPFWGQDRLDYLDHAISSGRGPFTP